MMGSRDELCAKTGKVARVSQMERRSLFSLILNQLDVEITPTSSLTATAPVSMIGL